MAGAAVCDACGQLGQWPYPGWWQLQPMDKALRGAAGRTVHACSGKCLEIAVALSLVNTASRSETS